MTPNQDKATARPWKVAGCAVYQADNWKDGNNIGGKFIVGVTEDCEPDDERAANAALIVTAVNEHAALLEVEKAAMALSRLAIETCPRCEGSGVRERGEVNEACGQCGGTGKETHNPHPDEIMDARKSLANLATVRKAQVTS